MKKTTTIILSGMICLFLVFIGMIFSRNDFSIGFLPLLPLFSCGLALILVNEIAVGKSKEELISISQLSNGVWSRLILCLANICLMAFIIWLMIRISSAPFYGAACMFSLIMLTWLFFPKVISKLSISNIVLIAIAIRLIWAFIVYTQPVSDFGDYWSMSQKMTVGLNPWQTKAPFVVMFYGAIYQLTGKLWGVYLINALFGGLQVWLIYRITCMIAPSQLSPRVAALLYALYPTAITFSSVVSSETPMIVMLLIATYLLCIKLRLDSLTSVSNYNWKNYALIIIIAFCVAAAYLSRNTGIIFLYLPILAIALISGKKWYKRLMEIMLFIFLFLIFISPQIIWNYNQYQKFSISSLPMSGVSLLSGTSRDTYGGSDDRKLREIVAKLGYSMETLHDSRVVQAVSKYASQEAIDNILQDKLGFFKFGFTHKFNRMWRTDAPNLAWSTASSQVFNHGGNNENRITIWRITDQYYWGLWLLVAFSTIFVFFRGNAMIVLMGGYILLTFLLHFFYEVQPRYHIPIMPFVCIIASYFISRDFAMKKFNFPSILNNSGDFIKNLFKLDKRSRLPVSKSFEQQRSNGK